MGEKRTAVIFDLDGTLLDTLDDITDSVNHVIVPRGFCAVSRDAVKGFVGNGAKRLIERAMYAKVGDLDTQVDDPALAEQCYNEFLAYYKDHNNVKTAPYEGILGVLEQLGSKGIPLAVVSNKPDDSVRVLCDSHFSNRLAIARGDRAGQPRKPDPTVLLDTIRELGCDTAIYVGDSEPDIRVAENAKIPSVLMTWGFRDRQTLIGNGAKILADNADELLAALSRLLGTDFGE